MSDKYKEALSLLDQAYKHLCAVNPHGSQIEKLCHGVQLAPPQKYFKRDALSFLSIEETISVLYPNLIEIHEGKAWIANCKQLPLEMLQAINLTQALIPWRITRNVYTFREELAQDLDAEIGTVPVEVLLQGQRDYCGFVIYPDCYRPKISQFPGLSEHFGFFYFIDYNFERKCYCLNLLPIHFTNEHMGFALCYINLLEGKTIQDCLISTFEHPGDEEHLDYLPYVTSCLNLLLYLACDNYEIQDKPNKKTAPKKTKKGLVYPVGTNPPKQIKVGYQLVYLSSQEAVSPTQSNGEHVGRLGTKKRTHLRRGHWHHYWVGSKKGDPAGTTPGAGRRLILKWVSHTLVNPNELKELTTIYKAVK